MSHYYIVCLVSFKIIFLQVQEYFIDTLYYKNEVICTIF